MMKRTLCVAAISSAMLLQGCAPSTAMGVRELGPERRFQFVAHENYQPVYRKVLDQTRKCYQINMITAQMIVQGDLYQDIKSGTITVALHGGLGIDTYAVIDMTAIDENSTQVIGHYARDNPETMGKVLQQWVLDGSKECSLVAAKK